MKIVITGISGYRNRGVEALGETAITEMRALWPNAAFTVVTTDPVYDASRNSKDVRVLRDSPGFFRQSRMRRNVLEALAPRKRLSHAHAVLAAIREADLVVASGGDVFSSEYGTGLLRRQLGLLDAAQSAGRKTAFLAHSIGPFKTDAEIALIKPVLQASSLITVRESFTRSYVVDKIGISAEQVLLTSDVAFLLPPNEAERARRIAALIGLPAGVPYVALGPSEGITLFSDARDRARHDTAWIETVQHFLETTDRHVVLIPHVQDANLFNDDAQIAFRLAERLNFPERLHIAAGPLSARDYKSLVAGADFFAGERMHACIAALSSIVPCLVISYSVKARGIVNDILEDHAHDGVVLSVADFVSHPDRGTLLSTAWERRDALRLILAQRIPVIAKRARSNFDALRALFT
ncbi:polysaccharide pyruvyl transferase family protein [Pseudorhodoferax sp. Leaf267]|uniref:polysaccharide pyruvyl transferase family protein n=1 Tax=Pseudorhodoferax sp. Leaf267 TaxID=1736316 RepID=UPI0006F9820A|nr:polysaccharide pyruvyl transferase family protein [Pseudorhodoferax sp. Leaf267]KQP17914.1 hypothetical protein ASF43_08595 [Pseudorhodoferax sp. Leaf267]